MCTDLEAGRQVRKAKGEDAAVAGLYVGHLARAADHPRSALQQLRSRGNTLEPHLLFQKWPALKKGRLKILGWAEKKINMQSC